MPRKFDGATVIERAAAYAGLVKGHEMAPESRKVCNMAGSAQRSFRDTSVFYPNDSISGEQALPLAATGFGHVYHRASSEEQASCVTTETFIRGPQAQGARPRRVYAGQRWPFS